jgi:hypothetical protein
MLQHKRILSIILIAIALFATACTGIAVGAGNGNDPEVGEGLPPVAAIRARETLSRELGIPTDEITIVTQERVTWTTSCLELGGPAESCMRIDVEGWRVTLEAGGETYVAHTDELGEQVRIAP